MGRGGDSEGAGGGSVPCTSPSFWCLLAVFDVPWLVEASPRTWSSSSLAILPGLMSAFKFPLFIRTPVMD